MKIKIWCPEDESEPAAWIELGMGRLDTAVRDFAEKNWTESNYWNSAEFHVRMEEGGLIRFRVSAEQSIDFHVSRGVSDKADH